MIARGFKGKYFSLAAIQATVSEKKIAALFSKARRYIYILQNYCKSGEEDIEELLNDPPGLFSFVSRKPCYCNLFFTCKAHRALKLSKIKKPPICPCRKTKTGLAPPLKFFLFTFSLVKN
ncbi:hypothetical protein [Nitrosophilus alvini]|uniref:hypothetical protein n=1 Tax=Nitrosophilus alvini TaxID=2714855 RepID=UPI0019094224|nr:hypothetical protein [Nitrosophilus alvini]